MVSSAAADTPNPGVVGPDRADYVVVDKSDRKLYLYKAGRVLREFDVSLGLVPNGPKQREGDFRTPEGKYMLDARNANSDFFLSIHVSYPDESDRARARAQGVDPGGQIMIHGWPNEPKYDLRRYREHRLDGRLHRRQQLRHGRHLAHDARIDADRDSPVSEEPSSTIPWMR